tara:strand:- start:409 stop:672 length:264 start_codon:yes stop_codon:yes gene_type:complete
MDLDSLYSIDEYQKLSDHIVGSLVKLDMSTPLFEDWRIGLGVVLEHRRFNGEFHLKIVWINSPFFSFSEERKIGWHNYSRLFILSKP